MEDILASIRRILNEDEVTPPSPEAGAPQAPAQPQEPNAGGSGGADEDDGVLVLDEAMLVSAPQPGPDIAFPTAGGLGPELALPPQTFPPEASAPEDFTQAFSPQAFTPQPFSPEPAVQPLPPVIAEPVLPAPGYVAEPASMPALDLGTGPGLLAPENAAAAASSVGALIRTITEERSSQVHRGGPTIEDVVREEVRPLLKQWLDQHLPPMVERLVRQEIERVTGRAAL